MKNFKLENEPKITSGFKTPEGYFDTFSEKVVAQLPKAASKIIPLYSRRSTWHLAAAVTVFLTLSVSIYNNYTTKTEVIDDDTLEEYIAYHSNVSEDQIVDLLDKEDLDAMKVNLNIQDEQLEEELSNNANLEQYLIN